MSDMNREQGNALFANVASLIFTLTVLALAWLGCVMLFGGWLGGLLGWIPAMMLAVVARILVFLCTELVEDWSHSSPSKLSQIVDRVPDRHWKWWLSATILGPTIVLAALFAILNVLQKR